MSPRVTRVYRARVVLGHPVCPRCLEPEPGGITDGMVVRAVCDRCGYAYWLWVCMVVEAGHEPS